MLREVWLNVGIEKRDTYKNVMVKALLDSSTTRNTRIVGHTCESIERVYSETLFKVVLSSLLQKVASPLHTMTGQMV